MTSHMSRFVAVAALVLAVASCQILEPRQKLELESRRGDRLRVTVIDGTGAGIVAQPGVPDTVLDQVGVVHIERSSAAPEVLYVAWLSVPCEREVTLTVRGVQGRLRLTLEPAQTDGCEAIGIAYGVQLRFGQPVDPSTVDAVMIRGGEVLRETQEPNSTDTAP